MPAPEPHSPVAEAGEDEPWMIPYHVKRCNRMDIDKLVRQHYLACWPGVVMDMFSLLGEGGVPIGAIVYSLPPRETCKRYGVDVWELARLYVIDGTPKNTESWFIARTVRMVRGPMALVSYADPSAGHTGTIYRAANWIADGRTDDDRKTPRFDYGVSVDGVSRIYSRRGHVPDGAEIVRIPRVSKPRFVYWLDGTHEARRQAKTK